MTRRFLNHSLRLERIQDFSTLPYGDHVSAFIIIQLVIIIIGNALKVSLSSTVSQIDFSVGTVRYSRRSLYRPHHCTDSSLSQTVYLVQKLENFIQERTLYPLLLYTITFSIAQLPIADSSLAPKDTKLHPIASSIITTPPYCG